MKNKLLFSLILLLSFATFLGTTFLLTGCDHTPQSEIETPDTPQQPENPSDDSDDKNDNKDGDDKKDNESGDGADDPDDVHAGGDTNSSNWNGWLMQKMHYTPEGKATNTFSELLIDSEVRLHYVIGSQAGDSGDTWANHSENYHTQSNNIRNPAYQNGMNGETRTANKARNYHPCVLYPARADSGNNYPYTDNKYYTYGIKNLGAGQMKYDNFEVGTNGVWRAKASVDYCNWGAAETGGWVRPSCNWSWMCGNTGQRWINAHNKNIGAWATDFLVFLDGIGHTINFSTLNNGRGGSVTGYYRDYFPAVSVPTKTGYIFKGYYTSSSGGTQIYNQNGRPACRFLYTNDITVYAQWTPITYYLKFDGNGATGGSMSNMTFTYDKYKDTTKNAFTKTGYTFAGWKMSNFNSSTALYYAGDNASPPWQSVTSSMLLDNGESFKNLTTTNGATVTLHAQWRANSYTATFDTNGGKVSPSSKSVTYDSTYGDLPEPTRPGYAFAGWKLSCLNEGLVATRTDTSWLTGWYTGIALKDIGVNLTVGSKYRFAFDIKTIDGTETIPWDRNCFFVNDNTKPDSLVNDMTKKPATSTSGITSTWTRYSAEFTYATDTTSSWKNDQIHIYPNFTDKTTQVQMTNIELVCLTSGKVTSSTTVKTDRDHKLFAQWTPNTYTLTLNANGGTGTTTKTVTRDSAVGALPTPTREGYTFKGWVGNMFMDYKPNIVGSTNYCVFDTFTNQNLVDYEDYTAVVKYKRPTNTSGTFEIFGDGSWMPLDRAPASDTLTTYTYHFNADKASAWTHGAAKRLMFYNIPSSSVSSSPADLIEIAIYRMKINGDAKLSAYVSDDDILTENSVIKMVENATVFASWEPNSYIVNFDTNGGSFANKTVPIDSDLNEWTIASGYNSAFKKISYVNGKNAVIVNGIGGWEHIYKTFTLRAGYTYTFSSYYNIITEITYQNTSFTESKGMRMQLFSGSVPPNQGGGQIAQCNFGYAIGSGTKSFTYKCTTTGTYCLSYNFGWLGDGEDIKLDVGDVSVNTNDPNFGSKIAVTYDSTYGSLPTPTREGYEFMGWSGAASTLDFSSWTFSGGATYDPNTGILTMDGENASATSPFIDVGQISSFYFYIYALCDVDAPIQTSVGYYDSSKTYYSGNGWSAAAKNYGVEVGKWGWVRTMYGASEQIKSGNCRYVTLGIYRDPTFAPSKYYVKKCAVGTADNYPKTYITSTNAVSIASNHTLLAEWKPVQRNVTIRVMSSGVGDDASDVFTESTFGMSSAVYSYYTCPTNGNDSTKSIVAITAKYTNFKHADGNLLTIYDVQVEKDRNYVFLGFTDSISNSSSTINVAPKITSAAQNSKSWKITNDTTIYLWFKKVSSNRLKYDEEEKYWYFEDGKTLQSYVGDTLNTTLNNDFDPTKAPDGSIVYYKNGEEKKIDLYERNGETYGWLTANKTYTMISKTLKLQGNTYFDGCESGSYSSDGRSATLNAKVVSGNQYNGCYINIQFNDGTNKGIDEYLVSEDLNRKCFEFTKTADVKMIRFKFNGSTHDSSFYLYDSSSAAYTKLFEDGHTYRFTFDYQYSSDKTNAKAWNMSLKEICKFEKDENNNKTYWFKYEPIRWRVSEYGVSNTSYPSGWEVYGSDNSGFMAVSENIVYASQMTLNQFDLGENRSYISSTKVGENSTEKQIVPFVTIDNGAYSMNNSILSGSFSYLNAKEANCKNFEESGSGSDCVTSTVSFKVRVASVEELQANFSDLRAKPTDFVAFLLGINSDQYCNYFTRDVGTKYYNMTGIGVDGTPRISEDGKVYNVVHDYYSNQFMGMRLAMNFTEGSRY